MYQHINQNLMQYNNTSQTKVSFKANQNNKNQKTSQVNNNKLQNTRSDGSNTLNLIRKAENDTKAYAKYLMKHAKSIQGNRGQVVKTQQFPLNNNLYSQMLNKNTMIKNKKTAKYSIYNDQQQVLKIVQSRIPSQPQSATGMSFTSNKTQHIKVNANEANEGNETKSAVNFHNFGNTSQQLTSFKSQH